MSFTTECCVCFEEYHFLSSDKYEQFTCKECVLRMSQPIVPIIIIECCVCFEEYDVLSSDKTKCNHFLCEECTLCMCQMTCPMCRSPLESNYITKSVKKEIEKRKLRANEERTINLLLEAIRNTQLEQVVEYSEVPVFFVPTDRIVLEIYNNMSQEERAQAREEYSRV